MVKNLRDGLGDLVIAPLSKNVSAADSLIFCGPEINESRWAVMYYNRELADSINAWFKPELLAKMKEMQEKYLSGFGGERHVYASFLDKEKGIISEWDHLFKKYAETANLDWKLLAAICYQESCFDPNAVSWAGACGLMQIMPKVAQAAGLPLDSIFDPERNVATSAKMINELSEQYGITVIVNVADRMGELQVNGKTVGTTASGAKQTGFGLAQTAIVAGAATATLAGAFVVARKNRLFA